MVAIVVIAVVVAVLVVLAALQLRTRRRRAVIGRERRTARLLRDRARESGEQADAAEARALELEGGGRRRR